MDCEDIKRLSRLPDALLPWYRLNARRLPWRETTEPYRIWLSEIMLQQTRVEAVKQFYNRFLETLPDVKALANVPEDLLLKLWEGLGYYSRAKNLKKAAAVIIEKFDGKFPVQYEDILSLPGVGEYTAGAVASICFGLPTPAVDGNVLRVTARLLELNQPVNTLSVKKEITTALSNVYPKGCCGEFTQALMELGATICVPNGRPYCDQCPAGGFCKAYQNGTQCNLPLRTEKKQRKIEKRTVFLLLHDGAVAINRRPDTGVLRGMWEFPNVAGELESQEAAHCLAHWQLTPSQIIKSARRKHIFTHIQWDMVCYCFACTSTNDMFTWVTREQLQTEIALPTAFRKFCEVLPP